MGDELHATLRSIADALPDGAFINDPYRGIVHANAAFRALLGRDDIVGRAVYDLLHPDDREPVRARIRAALETGIINKPRVSRFQRADGSYAAGECTGLRHRDGDRDLILVVVRDLAERERAERSEALFRTLIEELRIGVLVQGPSAEIVVSNRAALELLGLDESQLLGKTSFDPDWNVVHEDGTPFPGPEHPVPTAIRTRAPVRAVVMGVYRPRRKDRVWLLVDAEPQLDAEGNVVQVVCTFSDFTERRRVEAAAAAGDRLASMGRLAAGVAHEINNPLAYVIGHLDTLRHAPLDPALHALVEQAFEGAERVRTIVGDLRSLSRGDDERHGPVDLVRVIDSACNIAASHMRHRAQLVRDLQPVPMVEGNDARLGQLMLNLLLNAAEAIPEGRAAQNEIRVVARVGDPGHVIVEVHDTGTGIPANVIDRIFDPFFTTKPVGIGTGLGLPICHGIVTSMGGEIDVTSTVGRGSTFRVTLPASAQQASPESRPAVVSAPRSRVLIVDDEPFVGQVLAELLRVKHEVELEARAAAALARLARGEHFDVIICDLMMPDMTGMDLQEVLERDLPQVARRTIFMTGGAFTPRAHEFMERMAGRCIDKPFRIGEVEQVIARARADAPPPSDRVSR
jgi:PAS domain S-box-containing protein